MMTSFTANWEDEENNRIVELAVQCRLDGDSVEIIDITPQTVVFVDVETREPVRTLRVHTKTGRQVLSRLVRARGGLEQFQQAAEEAQLAEAL